MTKKSAKHSEENRERINAAQRERYAQNPQEYIDYQRAYRDKDSPTRAAYLASRRKYAEANRELIAERQRAYVARNIEKVRAADRRYHRENREARIASNRLWRANRTPEQIKKNYESSRRWQQENPEKAKAASLAWCKANPERVRERSRAWRKANPEKMADSGRRYRALKKGAKSDDHTFAELCEHWLAMGLDPEQCSYCDKRCSLTQSHGGPDTFSIDHVVPLVRGGSHCMDNLMPSCKGCNSSKNNRLLYEEWTPPNMREAC